MLACCCRSDVQEDKLLDIAGQLGRYPSRTVLESIAMSPELAAFSRDSISVRENNSWRFHGSKSAYKADICIAGLRQVSLSLSESVALTNTA